MRVRLLPGALKGIPIGKIMKHKILNCRLQTLVVPLLFLLLPAVQVLAQGLVPCQGDACTLCDFFAMINNVLKFILVDIVLPISAFLIVVAGFLMIFGAESPENIEKGKKILFSVVVGLILCFTAYLIVGFFFQVIGVAGWTGLTSWFDIKCN